MSRKRQRSVADKFNNAPKKMRLDVSNITSNENAAFPSEPGHDKLRNAHQTRRCIPHNLIELMYQLDLSVLCSLRKFTHGHKYPLLSLTFGDSKIGKFNNIILQNKEKSIHIQIENVDKYYVNNGISYARLFTKEKRIFSINNYFDSFVKHLNKFDSSVNNMEYFIIYTNSGLDLTEENKFKKGQSKNFYPFKFDSIDMEECEILKDFLFTNDNGPGRGFYRFSQDKPTRDELLKRLEFSSAMQKSIKAKKLSQKELSDFFLDKLVFAVNQPSREELNSIIKNELEKSSDVQDGYIELQKNFLRDLIAPEKQNKLGNYTSGTVIYEFNLLMFFLQDMSLHKNILSINSERKSCDITNNITVHYKHKNTYVKAHASDSNIGYSQLFPSSKQEKKDTFSVNKLFTLFVEELKGDIQFFIIYTNADLDVTKEGKLNKGRSKDFYPLQFDSIDIGKKKYKILKVCSCINENSLYQFAQEETREKLLSLLKLPPSLQKEKEEGRFSNENEREIKAKFLDKLIFAVSQLNKEKLNSIIKNKVQNNYEFNKVPYNYEELHEIALRWLESHEFGPITKEIMEKLIGDIKHNRSSCQEIQSKTVNEEIEFAKNVVGREGTSSFDQFLDFLIKGEGKKYLEVLKRNGINLSNMSNILHGAGSKSAKAFKDLYNFWFDEEGNKTQYWKALEKERISLANISSILHGARANASEALKDLYNLWFDEDEKKTQYLTILEKEGINLSNMSSILSGAGSNAPKAFKDLYDLWFDENGKKTQYLTKLKENGVDLVRMSSILSGSGANASKAFKDLYNLWFDENGNKTPYLITLEKEGINLHNMSSILHRAGAKASEAFKDLFNLWFDEQANKTVYLETLEKEGVNLPNMSSILGGAGTNAPKAFKGLYDLWFDQNGKKTKYLTKLKQNEVDLVRMSSILSGSGANASKAFTDLYNLWFDKKGNRTQYLKTLEKEEINLPNVSSILHRSGANASKAFKNLYNLLFDEQANKTIYLKTLEENGINLPDMSSVLHGAGVNASKVFKDLYDLLFDAEAQYLKTLEKEGISLSKMSSILGGAGANAPKAFKDLYDFWFDDQGNKKQYLKHFTENEDGKQNFTMHNLSSIFGGAGAQAKDAFEKFHNVCFNDKGERTELLEDFYNAGFKPSSLSCMLCKTGISASSILKRLHSNFFNEKREKTKLLYDFYDVGFRPGDLCSILSAAADDLEKFHDFCFTGKTKKYLKHFLNDGFTPKNLCNILHGARTNVCSALKNFHDVCFDKKGNKMQVLFDFHNAGFVRSDLANILTMAGNNASYILRNFHDCCFNKENYLNHFLAEKNVFTPKDLSKILRGVGINICAIFRTLHDLCFDKAGNITSYLNDLFESHPSGEVFNILREKI